MLVETFESLTQPARRTTGSRTRADQPLTHPRGSRAGAAVQRGVQAPELARDRLRQDAALRRHPADENRAPPAARRAHDHHPHMGTGNRYPRSVPKQPPRSKQWESGSSATSTPSAACPPPRPARHQRPPLPRIRRAAILGTITASGALVDQPPSPRIKDRPVREVDGRNLARVFAGRARRRIRKVMRRA